MARILLRFMGFALIVMLAIAVGALPFWRVGLTAEPAGEYTVKGGDSLRAIAKQKGVERDELAAANGLAINSTLYKRQTLTIPATEASTNAPMAVAAAPQVNAAEAPEGSTTYTVKAGDSLRSIARRLGVDLQALAEANGLQPNSPLFKRQVLIVPAADATPAPAEEPAADAAPEPTEEPATEEPAADATPEPTEEVAEEPAADATPEPTEEPTEEPAAEEPAADATPEPTEEPAAEEPAADATPEPTEEPTEEPAAEEPTDEAAAVMNIVDTAVSTGNFSFLIAALEAAGLTDALRGEGPFTVFAPVDAAFAGLSAPQLQSMLQDPEGDLTQILLYHVIPGAILAGEISDGATALTLQGGELTFGVDGDNVTVNGANILIADLFATNGVIHVIDSVLMPNAAATEATPEATAEPAEEPSEEAAPDATPEAGEEPTDDTAELTDELDNIIDTATAAGDFTNLIAALEAAGLADALKGEGPFTLFAPTDVAFAALPEGALDALLANPTGELTQILLYHVVPKDVREADLVEGLKLRTLQGDELTISVGPDGTTVNGANVIIADIETSNGVIHVIDSVLRVLGTASGPNGPLAPADEAASSDAASLIILPAPQTDAAATAALWPQPSGNLAVFSPVEAGAYHSPIRIIGLARSAEGFVTVDLVADNGEVLAQRAAQAGLDEYAFYHVPLRFSVFSETPATLNIIEMDMADGSILSAINVPLMLIPGQPVIDVTTPVVGELACEHVLVSGYSNTFEANVVLTLQEPLGIELEQMPVIGGTMGNYRDFVAQFDYTSNKPMPLLVSLEESDASGRFPSIDKTVVPLILYPAYSAVCH